MKKLLSFLLALVLVCVSSAGYSLADTAGNDLSVRDWLEDGEQWFCEEHHQIAVDPEDIPEGYEQVCMECHPMARIRSRSAPSTDGNKPQALLPSSVYFYYSSDSGSYKTGGYTKASTLIGEDQSIIYYTKPGTGYLTLILNFSSVVSPIGKYLWFSYGGAAAASLTASSFRFAGDSTSWNSSSVFDQVSLTPIPKPSQLGYVFSGMTYQNLKLNCYELKINVGSSSTPVYFGQFYCAAAGYTAPGGGAQPEPEKPGFSDEKGWLGSLISGIVEGINELISGVSAMAGSIASLPSNIAGSLSGFFKQVVSAVIGIGDRITGALTSLGKFIIGGLQDLFIPSEGFFSAKAAEMQSWLEAHLGLLVYPFTQVADLAARVAAMEGGEPSVHIPEIAYTDGGSKYVLIQEQTINLYDQVGRNEIFLQLHQLYLMAMDAAIGGTLMLLAWRKFDQITGGRST